jgi:serine/threonine protein kinase
MQSPVEIASGGFSKVFKSKMDGSLVAVKTYTNAADWNEMDIMNNFSHPNIVSALSIITEPSKNISAPGVVMELGKEIETLTFLNIVELCQGLHFLHQRGVLHQDLKRRNMILVNGVAKLIDYGMSVVSSPERIQKGFYAFSGGTVLHIAPENAYQMMIKSRSVSSTKGDIFSFGWVLMTFFDRSLGMRPTGDAFEQVLNTYLKENEENRKSAIEKLTKRENFGVVTYYYHLTFIKNDKNLKALVEKTVPLDFSNRGLVVNIIHLMLQWDPKHRLEMDEYLFLLNTNPIPGLLSFSIPEASYQVDMAYLEKMINALNNPKLEWTENADVIHLFSIVDLYCRISRVIKKDPHTIFMTACSYVFYASKQYRNERWVNDEGGILYITTWPNKSGKLTAVGNRLNDMMNMDLLTLLDGTLSLNLFYRSCNGIEALKYCYQGLMDGTLDYDTDIFKLKGTLDTFKKSSKKMDIWRFLNIM